VDLEQVILRKEVIVSLVTTCDRQVSVKTSANMSLVVNNTKSVKQLGLSFRSDEECFLQLVEQLLEIERRTG
jgi:hypothetical protein